MDALIGSKRKQKEVGFDKSKGRLARIKEGGTVDRNISEKSSLLYLLTTRLNVVISARIDLTEALKKRDTVKWLTSFRKHKARDSKVKTNVRCEYH